MAMSNFVAAGPVISTVETALDFFPDAVKTNSLMASAIPKTAYFLTTTSLLQGLVNFIWVPMANKWGRRPVYLLSYLVYFVVSVWAIFEKSYAGFLIARILMEFGSGAAETLGPMSISDVFFLHERGRILSFYTCFLSVGAVTGLVMSGLITIHNDWRTIYRVGATLVGLVLLLIVLAFPETAYSRDNSLKERLSVAGPVNGLQSQPCAPSALEGNDAAAKRPTYVQSLKVFSGTKTTENFFKMMIRPFGLILLPPVLWAALVNGVTIGFLVAVTSNVGPAFEQTYHFKPYQVGLCVISGLTGSLLGLPADGHFGDMVADFFDQEKRWDAGARDAFAGDHADDAY